MKSIIKQIIALSLFFTFQAQAKRSCNHDGDKIYSFKKIKSELNLTSEQIRQIKADSNKPSKEMMKQKRKAMKEAQNEIENALKNDLPDDQVRAQFNELQKLQEEFSKARFEKILRMRSVLTAEQKTKFKTVFGKK